MAASGQTAIQKVVNTQPNLILMDMHMPEMDSLEATRCIHEQWSAEKRPWIIAITANALEGDQSATLKQG